MSILDRISAYADDLVALRRDLHAHPELGFKEERTSGIVARHLAEWGIEVHLHDIFTVLKNHDEQAAAIGAAATELFGKESVAWLDQPRLGSEDFADMLQMVPAPTSGSARRPVPACTTLPTSSTTPSCPSAPPSWRASSKRAPRTDALGWRLHEGVTKLAVNDSGEAAAVEHSRSSALPGEEDTRMSKKPSKAAFHRGIVFIFAGAIASVSLVAAASAQAPEAFYKGKQLRMIIPAGAGGGYDTYARVLSQHLERHIPGNPSIVNQNMPGASGMVATNWVASVAPKDGSVIAATYNALLLEPLFGNPAVKYDTRELEWIGSMGKQQQICVTWHTSPIKTIEQAKQREVVVAATGATGNSATMPKLLNAMLGTKFKVVTGYSTSESRLAVERGEAEGVCGLSFSTLKASNPDWIDNKRINVLVQTGTKPQPGLPDVPLLVDLAANPEDKKVLEILAYPEEMGRPFFMPPGTPKPLVNAMRRAFDAAVKDPMFLADAEKSRLEIDPLTGEEMEQMISRAFATPKPLLQRALELSK